MRCYSEDMWNTLCKVMDDDIVNGTVVIPDTIECIGAEAFKDCNFLKFINLPNSVNRIDDSAFKGCQKLKEINLPEGLDYIGKKAFSNCASLTNITIPKRVVSINVELFCDCVSLKNVNVMGNLEKIEEGAFANCENLRNFSIAKGLKYLGNYAFQRCFHLNLNIETSLLEAFQDRPISIITGDMDVKYLQIYHHHTTYRKMKIGEDNFGNPKIRDAFEYERYIVGFIDSARKQEIFDIIKHKLHEKGIKGIKYYKYKEHEKFIENFIERFYALSDVFNYIESYVNQYIKSCVKVKDNKTPKIEEITNETPLEQIDDIASKCLDDNIDIIQNSVKPNNSMGITPNEIARQDDKTSQSNNNYQHIFSLLSKLPDDEIALIGDMVKNDFLDENIENYINMSNKERLEVLQNQLQELNKPYKVSLEKEPIEVYKARQKQKNRS